MMPRRSFWKESKKRSTFRALERLERRVLLSAFSNADLTGLLTVAGMNQVGTVISDGNGNIVGGSETKDDGTTDVPNGTYSLSENGTLTIPDTSPKSGAMNSSKNVTAFSGQSSNSLTVIVSSVATSYSNADLSGTWYEFDNGDSGPPDNPPLNYNDNSGHAIITFDGKGGLTYQHFEDETGKSDSGTGTYAISNNGAVAIVINGSGNTLHFSGAMNNSKDVVATARTDLPQAALTNDTRMLVLARPDGVYSNADLNGNWTIVNDGGQGTLTFDGAGNISGIFNSFDQANGPQAQVITGSYAVAADGSFTAGILISADGLSQSDQLNGMLNASRNVAFFDQPNSGENGLDDLGVLISPGTPLGATVSLNSSSNLIAPSQSLALTATLAPVRLSNNIPGGSVDFFDGGTLLGSATVQPDGTASISISALAAGTHLFKASYAGDAAFAAASSLPTSVVVSIPQTIGGLDPSFGAGGRASHEIGFSATGGAAQTGAQSVIIGTVGAAPSESFGVTRYNADGSLDSSFGGGGVVNTSFGQTDDTATAVAVLSTGQILVAGTATSFVDGAAAGSQFAVAEYNADGSPDTAFGGGTGQVLVSFSTNAGTISNDELHAMILGPGGIIYLGGSSDAGGAGQDFALAALNPDGSADVAFASGGKTLLDFSGGNDSIAALAIETDGSIIAAGSAAANGVVSLALADFLPAGGLNSRFGVNGKEIANVRGVNDQATAVAIQPGGQILVGGLSATGSAAAGTLSSDFLLQRYTSVGKLDRTFSGGTVITTFGQPAVITDVVIQANGGIVASGKTTASLASVVSGQLDVGIARYTSSGALDTAFNGTGKAIVNLSSGTVRSAGLVVLDASPDLEQALNDLIASDEGALTTNSGGELLIAGTSDTATVQVAIVTAGIDLATSLLSAPPAAVIGGAKGMLSVALKESGTELAAGPATIVISVSRNAGGGEATSIASFVEKINLKANKAKTYKLKFTYPASLPAGNYYVIASVDTGGQHDLDIINNVAASHSAVEIAAPFVQLNVGSVSLAGPFVKGIPASVAFNVVNAGNQASPSSVSAELFASADGTQINAVALQTVSLRLSLKPGKAKLVKQKIAAPTNVPPGTYFLLILVDPNDLLHEPSAAERLFVSGGTFTAS